MKKILLILTLLGSIQVIAQGEAANWYFGFGAGMQFDQTTGTTTVVNDGQLSTNEGCSTISDANGNLFFYSDGITVWNRNHQAMPNGTGLFGDPSSTQSALVVPKPDDPNIYYIFTVDIKFDYEPVDHGLSYSVVDMSLDGGLGDVTADKNINLLGTCSEKITAVLKDCITKSIWVVTFASVDGGPGPYTTYHSFEVNNLGVNTTAVKTTFGISINDQRGYLKLSPDGTKMACANMTSGLFLYDFDENTGIPTNQQQLIINSPSFAPYGIEFSPNSQLLYVHSSNSAGGTDPANHSSVLTQFNLAAADIQTSEFILDDRQLYRGGLQLGPNGKIYRALSATYPQGLPFLGVINNPNNIGAAANYQHDAISLSPNLSSQGLPPFIQSIFNSEIDIIRNGLSITNLSLCDGDTYTLFADPIVGATYTWTLDGNPLAENDLNLIVTQAGHYQVYIDPNNGDCAIEGEAFVSYFTPPIANQPTNIDVCDNDNDGFFIFDFTVDVDAQVIGAQDPATFSIHYFETANDATNNANEIVMPYQNIANPQEIFVRINNDGFTDCFDITSFFIEIFDTPTANQPINIDVCDNDNDGFFMFDFTVDVDAQVLNTQDPATFSVHYFETANDATNNINEIVMPYQNITSLQEIFVRIENDGFTNCFDITSFFIEIFDTPAATQPLNIDVCDNDNDDLFIFDFTVDVDAQVLNTQDPATFSIHYFETANDATNNINEIVMPYQNITSLQEIFVRIENDGFTDCFDTTSFFIEIFDTPTVNSIGDFEVCDDTSDGDNMNGQTTVDLLEINTLVLGSQDALLYYITYHSSQLDADSGTAALPLSYYNSTPNIEVIFVRIENILNINCYDTMSFNLVVNIAPETFNDTLIQCDEDGNVDGLTTFNLTEANDVLTGGFADRSTKFFLSLTDAQANINEIDGNSYDNITNPQTIYVQVINDITGCLDFAELILDVSLTNANDAILTTCDDDGIEDGFYAFNLSDADADVLNGITINVTLNYYETYNDALLEQNPLPNSYINTMPYSHTIYVRVENDNACFGINQVQLTVFELPDIEIEDEALYCLNFFPQTITLTGGIIKDLPGNYSYLWSTGETTSEIEINQPGSYSVTVTNVNGCAKDRTITVLPSNIATIESVVVTDATLNNTITVNVSGEGTYGFALDDSNGPYQDSNFFENVAPGLHTVYVIDKKNNCGIVEEIVSVIGFPLFFTPNNDSYNDTWQVYGLSNQFQPNTTIFIYDRYGKLLKQLDPTGPGWDGTFNGHRLPSNDYWFHVTLQDGRVFKSHFTLKY
ncbi:MAG: T9SS type B sorting domain-containing protein [Flavobacteriaceae bacterium]|nr:T9SS type B sorting domain-containing protein [Flavobacteriaceae bacterium]